VTKFRMRDAIFPLTLVAFEAVGVRYWQIVFTDKTRWLFLAILFLSVLTRGGLLLAFRNGVGVVLGAYILWCACTTLWSESPQLSLMKSLALAVTLPAFFGAGSAWTFNSERSAPFGFLLPIVVLALFAGLFDRGAAIQGGTIQTYQGLTGNPNYLGGIVAMAFPYAIWQAYITRATGTRYLLAYGVLAALAIVLWYAGSRASMLAVLMTLVGFILALGRAKRTIAFSLILLSIGVAVAVPAIQTSVYERFVVKGNVETGDALYTRREVWAESYELAKQGGITGAGYSVSIGGGDFAGGLTVVGYGREKGNSQLAIWEETGLVGLALFALLILMIISDLGSNIFKIKDAQRRVELGLSAGAIVGFTVHSVFEAWWGSPGAPEFAFFWSMVGGAYGIVRRTSFDRRRERARLKAPLLQADPLAAFKR
jgi:O-antigen ligase